MNILIISKYFAPLNGIASLRWSKIVKYLAKKDNYDSINVIAWQLKEEDKRDEELLKDIQNADNKVKVFYVEDITNDWSTKLMDAYHLRLKQKGEFGKHDLLSYTPYNVASLKEKIKMNLKYLRYLYYEKRFAKLAFKIYKKNELQPDVVVTSYGDFGDLILALKIKKHNPSVKIVTDYRDPVIRYFWPPILNPFMKRLIKQMSNCSEKIIGVTKECIDAHQHPEKNIIIPNGYDIDDKILDEDAKCNDGKFHICLTGTVYTNRRDHFYVLYDALKELNQEKKIDLSRIVIDYAGKYSEYVLSQARVHEMDKYINDYGYVTRKEALILQKKANILLVLSCNNIGESGVLTGKFLEYMMSEKVILALISGNLSNSIIKQIMDEANLGFCYEEATSEEDFCKLKEFLYEKYCEFTSSGNVQSTQNKNVVSRFDYRNIANEVDCLLRSVYEI